VPESRRKRLDFRIALGVSAVALLAVAFLGVAAAAVVMIVGSVVRWLFIRHRFTENERL
jgi:hypothetical protein